MTQITNYDRIRADRYFLEVPHRTISPYNKLCATRSPACKDRTFCLLYCDVVIYRAGTLPETVRGRSQTGEDPRRVKIKSQRQYTLNVRRCFKRSDITRKSALFTLISGLFTVPASLASPVKILRPLLFSFQIYSPGRVCENL